MTHKRAGELRAEAQKLYEEAAKIKHGDDRLVVVLRALVCEAEADALERESIQQQQQPQSKDDKNE